MRIRVRVRVSTRVRVRVRARVRVRLGGFRVRVMGWHLEGCARVSTSS